MCIIIDTNCFAAVFNRTSEKHSEFAPVLNWIICGNGKAVYGGTKYRNELTKAKRYLRIFGLLKQCHRLIMVNDNEVDIEQKRVESIIMQPDFDDPHLAAIVIVSRCKLICSEDVRSIPHVTNISLYARRSHVPKYYTGLRNKRLLCDRNIPERYSPFTRNTKEIAGRILNSI